MLYTDLETCFKVFYDNKNIISKVIDFYGNNIEICHYSGKYRGESRYRHTDNSSNIITYMFDYYENKGKKPILKGKIYSICSIDHSHGCTKKIYLFNNHIIKSIHTYIHSNINTFYYNNSYKKYTYKNKIIYFF